MFFTLHLYTVGDGSTVVAFLVLRYLCFCFFGYLVGEFSFGKRQGLEKFGKRQEFSA